MKKLLKKLIEFLLCVVLMGGVSYVSAIGGVVEAKIKFSVGGLSYTLDLP